MSNHSHLQDLKRRQQTASSWKVTRRLLGFMKPYWKSATAATLLQIVQTAFMFIPAYILGKLVVRDLNTGVYDHMWKYALLIVGVEVLRFGLTFVRTLVHVHATGHAEWDMQVLLYDALQHMSLSYHDRESSGQLISRMIMDMRFVGTFYRMVLFGAIESSLVYTVGIALLLVFNWKLALISLIALPAAVWLVVRFATRVRLKFYDVREQYGELTTVISENLAGVQVVRAFAREQDQIDRFDRRARTLMDRMMEATRIWAFNAPMVHTVVTLGLALTFFVAGRMTIGTGDPDLLGTVVTFFFILRIITERVGWIGRTVSHAQRAIASADRIFEMLDETPTITNRRNAEGLREGPGRVVFENVSFSYPGGPPVLRNIDLDVEPGQMVALVGRTGSGKSTLVSLLPRFYEVSEGRILIDGQDVRDVTLNSLRSDIGLVFQDSFLFSRSVAENIAYANPDADLKEITNRAQAARAHDFVSELPDGYDTVIGERGVTLSGGQRQRLTIARALMKDPRVLILDDSTSSVDPTTEREIHEAMMHLAKYRTTFVIAHRLSTVRRADVIIVLDGGRIVEKGTHDELLARGGIYRTIRDMQFGLEDEDADRETLIRRIENRDARPAQDLAVSEEEGGFGP